MSAYPERAPACRCHQNARDLVRRHPELTYVEGHLVFDYQDDRGEMYRLDHAWAVTPAGDIIDPTAWPYAGQQFRYLPA